MHRGQVESLPGGIPLPLILRQDGGFLVAHAARAGIDVVAVDGHLAYGSAGDAQQAGVHPIGKTRRGIGVGLHGVGALLPGHADVAIARLAFHGLAQDEIGQDAAVRVAQGDALAAPGETAGFFIQRIDDAIFGMIERRIRADHILVRIQGGPRGCAEGVADIDAVIVVRGEEPLTLLELHLERQSGGSGIIVVHNFDGAGRLRIGEVRKEGLALIAHDGGNPGLRFDDGGGDRQHQRGAGQRGGLDALLHATSLATRRSTGTPMRSRRRRRTETIRKTMNAGMGGRATAISLMVFWMPRMEFSISARLSSICRCFSSLMLARATSRRRFSADLRLAIMTSLVCSSRSPRCSTSRTDRSRRAWASLSRWSARASASSDSCRRWAS